ncbi:MAG: DNA helicase [Stutzerimonas stutzeri]|nr:MAG: DNA helicase [Stutzerimonas stutzeri]
MDESEGQFEFDPGFQTKIAALFTRDTTFAMKNKDLLKPEYFTNDAAGALVRIVQEHIKVYRAVPDLKILPTILKDEIAAKRIRPDMIEGIKTTVRDIVKADLSNPAFVTNKVTEFAKHQAVEQAMMASIGLLEKRDWNKIAELMKHATSIGANGDDDDYDYWEESKNRAQYRRDLRDGKIIRDGITTGYSAIDANLYHMGWGRKELSCMMGAAKAGKSMSLGDFARNANLAGYHVYYDTLEVSRDIIADRLDAANADTLMKELHKRPDDVEKALLRLRTAKTGHFKMREHASGTLKPSVLHRTLERYRADGIIFDLVVVDYADIMASEYRSDSLQENLRTIYIDLRAIAFETNTALLTATQTNRDGAKAHTAKATDVGDDWNKARTVDLMIGIDATDVEKNAGEARLSFLLSRNGESGFGLRIRQDRSKMQFITKILGRV